MSNSIIKLIDNALLPAVLLVFSKFGGIVLIASLFNVQLIFPTELSNIWNFTPFVPADKIILITTYADLFMFSVVALGFVLVLINALYFHNSHISVGTISKLADLNMLDIIKGSYDLYRKGFTWLVFIWISTIVILFDVIRTSAPVWVLLVTFIVSLILSVFFFQDLFFEFDLNKQKNLNNER